MLSSPAPSPSHPHCCAHPWEPSIGSCVRQVIGAREREGKGGENGGEGRRVEGEEGRGWGEEKRDREGRGETPQDLPPGPSRNVCLISLPLQVASLLTAAATARRGSGWVSAAEPAYISPSCRRTARKAATAPPVSHVRSSSRSPQMKIIHAAKDCGIDMRDTAPTLRFVFDRSVHKNTRPSVLRDLVTT